MSNQTKQPVTFRQALGTFFGGIAKRPPIIMAAIGSLVTALTGDVAALDPYNELLGLAVGSFFGYLASRLVAGPETAETLATAVLDSEELNSGPPSPKALEAAKRVLKRD